MIISSGTFHGMRWYIKMTEIGVICAYVDVSDHKCVERRTGDEQDYDFGAPGGITYAKSGLSDWRYEDISPDHWFIGWDYGHDMQMIISSNARPKLKDIKQDISEVISNVLAYEHSIEAVSHISDAVVKNKCGFVA